MQGLFWTQEEGEDPGRYGDCTQDNVAAFQYKHAIEVDDQFKEVDFSGRQIWPGGPKNKNK
jgi:hypothetical protein